MRLAGRSPRWLVQLLVALALVQAGLAVARPVTTYRAGVVEAVLAVQSVVARQFEMEADYFRQRFGAEYGIAPSRYRRRFSVV